MKPIKIKFNAYRNVNSQAGSIYSTMAVSPALCSGEKRYGGLQPIIMTIYELDTTRPKSGEKEDSTPTAPQNRGGGEDSDDSPRDGIQEPTTCFHCLRYGRSEAMKRWRKLVGDNGGIKFQGKLAKARYDGCTNTITNVSKDNLIMIQWQR